MNGERGKSLPGRGARIGAFLLALLLTGLLALTALVLGGRQLLSDPGIHLRCATAEDAVTLQITRIREKLTAIAGEYGFSPDVLTALVLREDVEALDEQVVHWWIEAVDTGVLGDQPDFQLTGVEQALRENEAWIAGLNPMTVNNTVNAVVSKANRAVAGSAVLFREMLVRTGIELAGRRVNLNEILGLLKRLPGLLGLCCGLCGGLIALLMSRRILTAGQYIGGAFGGAGLLLIGAIPLLKALRLREMIGEASDLLAVQFVHLARTADAALMICGIGMIALGLMLMVPAKKAWERT